MATLYNYFEKSREPHVNTYASKSLNITPSQEQDDIIHSVNNNNNVIADCVAGSGKTTTVLLIAHKF